MLCEKDLSVTRNVQQNSFRSEIALIFSGIIVYIHVLNKHLSTKGKFKIIPDYTNKFALLNRIIIF